MIGTNAARYKRPTTLLRLSLEPIQVRNARHSSIAPPPRVQQPVEKVGRTRRVRLRAWAFLANPGRTRQLRPTLCHQPTGLRKRSHRSFPVWNTKHCSRISCDACQIAQRQRASNEKRQARPPTLDDPGQPRLAATGTRWAVACLLSRDRQASERLSNDGIRMYRLAALTMLANQFLTSDHPTHRCCR